MNKNKLLHSCSIFALLIAGGCQNYLERHDGVTTHAGNHLAVNEAKMASDPWKRNAYDTHLHGNGKRTADLIDKYEKAHSPDEGGQAQPAFVLPAASGAETN